MDSDRDGGIGGTSKSVEMSQQRGRQGENGSESRGTVSFDWTNEILQLPPIKRGLMLCYLLVSYDLLLSRLFAALPSAVLWETLTYKRESNQT